MVGECACICATNMKKPGDDRRKKPQNVYIQSVIRFNDNRTRQEQAVTTSRSRNETSAPCQSKVKNILPECERKERGARDDITYRSCLL